jgi:hypothetical protein
MGDLLFAFVFALAVIPDPEGKDPEELHAATTARDLFSLTTKHLWSEHPSPFLSNTYNFFI